MKKNLIVILLFSIKLLGQQNLNIKVTYYETLSFDAIVKKKAELIFNDTNSYYIKKKSENVIEKKAVTVKKYGKKKEEIININLLKDSIFELTSTLENTFLVCEKIKKINWEIQKESADSILRFKTLKAIGSFRGRKYTVWFTEDIPTKFGPWKLHGLPGLILKAKDNLNNVLFSAVKIELIKNTDDVLSLNKTKYRRITLKNYVEIRNKDINNRIKRILSKIPRGSKVKNLKRKKYKGLELEYEWQKKIKGN